jgi:hypothetical protein
MLLAGAAMCPTLNAHALKDKAAVDKLVLRLIPRPGPGTVAVGDVVAFANPRSKHDQEEQNLMVRPPPWRRRLPGGSVPPLPAAPPASGAPVQAAPACRQRHSTHAPWGAAMRARPSGRRREKPPAACCAQVRRIAAMQGDVLAGEEAGEESGDEGDEFVLPDGHCWVLAGGRGHGARHGARCCLPGRPPARQSAPAGNPCRPCSDGSAARLAPRSPPAAADNEDLEPPSVIDSRTFGPLPFENIRGRVIYQVRWRRRRAAAGVPLPLCLPANAALPCLPLPPQASSLSNHGVVLNNPAFLAEDEAVVRGGRRCAGVLCCAALSLAESSRAEPSRAGPSRAEPAAWRDQLAGREHGAARGLARQRCIAPLGAPARRLHIDSTAVPH